MCGRNFSEFLLDSDRISVGFLMNFAEFLSEILQFISAGVPIWWDMMLPIDGEVCWDCVDTVGYCR